MWVDIRFWWNKKEFLSITRLPKALKLVPQPCLQHKPLGSACPRAKRKAAPPAWDLQLAFERSTISFHSWPRGLLLTIAWSCGWQVWITATGSCAPFSEQTPGHKLKLVGAWWESAWLPLPLPTAVPSLFCSTASEWPVGCTAYIPLGTKCSSGP